jgi:NAD(P)-dependent dehydrogenase (short-subunit alcohol dehydrogenase family)
MPAYSAGKGGLRMFSKAIALDFARRRCGIRVNSIYPGLIDASLTTPLFESMRGPDSGKSLEEIRTQMILKRKSSRFQRVRIVL